MKKTSLICTFLLGLILMAGCASPKKTANEFKDALMKKDFEKAAALTEMENVEPELVVATYHLFYDDLKEYEIEKIDKISANSAVAQIHIVHETAEGESTEDGNLNLIKKDGRWLINY